MRFNGCPSLTLRENPDPLRDDPIAHVDDSCVGCGVCGEVAHAAVLCPSFYEVRVIRNPSRWQRLLGRFRHAVIARLGAVEQRIALDLFVDEALQLDVGELQQPNRLHELRRHHQRLGLS
jgi:indolepyruvate ferredoxin oxidoreductase alpha subunit